jgi:hypothetical protein
MAVEFRHRGWFSRDNVDGTVAFLRANELPLVVCDDLSHELLGSTMAQRGPYLFRCCACCCYFC